MQRPEEKPLTHRQKEVLVAMWFGEVLVEYKVTRTGYNFAKVTLRSMDEFRRPVDVSSVVQKLIMRRLTFFRVVDINGVIDRLVFPSPMGVKFLEQHPELWQVPDAD